MYYTTALVEFETGSRKGKWLQLHVGNDAEEVRRLECMSKGIRADSTEAATVVHNWLLEMRMHRAEYVLAYYPNNGSMERVA